MIMLVMAASLLLIVSGFYYYIVNPRMNRALANLVKAHAQILIERQPDLETARAYSRHLNMEIRFEGVDTAWSTDESVPTVADLEFERGQNRFIHFLRSNQASGMYYIAEAPDGVYVFANRFEDDWERVHEQILVSLLVIMTAVFLAAYLVLKRALRPLKLLNTGVLQLSEGHLDVVVTKQSEDEFGALTDAFNRMARRVRDMVQAREQLLLDVSHELRSPLTRMKVALELVPDDSYKQAMATDINEMETMVTELLELNRLASGVDIKVEDLDLVELVRGVAERFEGRPPGVVVKALSEPIFLAAEPDHKVKGWVMDLERRLGSTLKSLRVIRRVSVQGQGLGNGS
jgi:signal transduction histidine kinase